MRESDGRFIFQSPLYARILRRRKKVFSVLLFIFVARGLAHLFFHRTMAALLWGGITGRRGNQVGRKVLTREEEERSSSGKVVEAPSSSWFFSSSLGSSFGRSAERRRRIRKLPLASFPFPYIAACSATEGKGKGPQAFLLLLLLLLLLPIYFPSSRNKNGRASDAVSRKFSIRATK